jgi:hypothetical protein
MACPEIPWTEADKTLIYIRASLVKYGIYCFHYIPYPYGCHPVIFLKIPNKKIEQGIKAAIRFYA